jgi:DNA-binding NtrC family response regulator
MTGSYALIGSSAIIRHVQHLVFKIAEGGTTVLITGEPGTGKEIIAKMIHERSSRATSPFIPLKCTNLSEEALEIELFGMDSPQGKRNGIFTQAENGTVFLEEMGQISLKTQQSLLRLLQENTIIPVGSSTAIPTQTRIICSSSFDLEQLVRRGQFREDLFYKLSASSIYLPPLRERREDISILAEFFVQKYNQLKNKKITGISHDAMNAMLQNSWKNNIQELENLIERIVVLKNAGSIEICDLPPKLRSLVTDNIDTFYDKQAEITSQQQNFTQQQNYNMPPQRNHHSLHTSQGNNMGMHGNQNTPYHNYNMPQTGPNNNMGMGYNQPQNHMGHSNSHYQPRNTNHNLGSLYPQNYQPNPTSSGLSRLSMMDDMPSEIDQFIKKEIDLGAGIDFYRVVEEFENRLISEALRRTNHNKNRAAQLLSMNRTTLVEKLKKRASNSSIKSEGGKIKRNSAFTIFDGLGNETNDFEGIDFLNVSNDDPLT